MKISGVLLSILSVLVFPANTACFAAETVYINAVINNKAADVMNMLEKVLPDDTPVVYTVVPRGLIVSIKEDIFFKGENILLNKSSTAVLDAIGSVLRQIGNNCTVESHTEGHNNTHGVYRTNWEISMARAESVADYLIYCGQIPASRVFTLGYGDCMPFRDSVSASKKGFDRRIDFVIFDYEYKRD